MTPPLERTRTAQVEAAGSTDASGSTASNGSVEGIDTSQQPNTEQPPEPTKYVPAMTEGKAPKLPMWLCPLCFRDQGSIPEEEEGYRVCVAFDGNNSLKRRHRGEPIREHESKYRLSPDFVNKFANQTKSRSRGAKAKDSNCEDNWQAATHDSVLIKNMFDEVGYFTMTCRHGIVLGYADMIKEHEGSKFPLALAKWLLQQYPGEVTFGYDIGCVFDKTFERAPVMQEVDRSRVKMGESMVHSRQSADQARLMLDEWTIQCLASSTLMHTTGNAKSSTILV